MQIENSVFLITGGGSGLGAATARRLAAGGASVVLADVNVGSGDQVATSIGERARFVQTDVADENAVQRAVDTARDTFGGLHGVVNCAGIATAERVIGRSGPHALDTFTRTLMVNLLGTFNVIRLASMLMQTNAPGPSGERGVIVNTASVAAYDGQIGQAAYAASKGGIVAMTLPIARELARFGIRVMTIAPGIFETPLLAGLPKEAQESLGKQVPFPARLGHPDEYAALVAHIVENQMLNGEVIRLDGAIRMAPR
jgi:NAD(P)-dependent dehydrogenase (short-subunit alcohol dehydrogenase family)